MQLHGLRAAGAAIGVGGRRVREDLVELDVDVLHVVGPGTMNMSIAPSRCRCSSALGSERTKALGLGLANKPMACHCSAISDFAK